MSLQGLPDFQQPIQGKGFQIFFPYQKGGNHVLTPDRLEIAERNDGRPDFLLELVRGTNPLLPPMPYGVLDFRLRPGYPMQEALTLLRSSYPAAMVDRALFLAGFLRLQPVGDADVPKELLKPVPVSWNGLGIARFTVKISRDSAVLLKRSIEGELITFRASAEMEMLGVSPRIPCRIRFDPAKLFTALTSLADPERRVAREDVVNLFRRDRSLPVEVIGNIDDQRRGEFAEAVTDRVRMRFAAFAPSPKSTAAPYFALVSPGEVGSGIFEWDLSEPTAVRRSLVLDLHPLEAARELVKAQGLETVYRETVVPPLSTGAFPVLIAANLPAERPSVASLGVTLRVPPRPPQRFQAMVMSAELKPPEDTSSVLLRLSPLEKPEYTFSTFVVLEDSKGIRQLDGKTTSHAGDRLHLSPDDFPVDFIPVEASAALLDLSVVHGTCRWSEGGTEVTRRFELDRGRSAVALALPRGTEVVMFEVEARSRDEAKTLKLGPFSAKSLQLDLHVFPEYGPHKIEIECVFGPSTQLMAIDLLPEDSPEKPQEITVFSFTPERSKREWTWFATSPFRAGYRYRPHRGSAEVPAAWSEVRSPFHPLKINVGAAAGGVR